ncbi:hypothetical protein G7Y79_00049g084570 [Physcia stellaris]|nr:hypothetical protein G7Y79_00049g084570 [Physcia stellaris]
MQFSMLLTCLAGASTTLAVPAKRAQAPICSGVTNNAVCCSTSLGPANLICNSPFEEPKSVDDFELQCATKGQVAKCCAAPVAGQALVCKDPSDTPSKPAAKRQEPGQEPLCSGVAKDPLCCYTRLGPAHIFCTPPRLSPFADVEDFKNESSVAGQALVCKDPSDAPSKPAIKRQISDSPKPAVKRQISDPPKPAVKRQKLSGPICPTAPYTNPQCCEENLLGVANTNCENRRGNDIFHAVLCLWLVKLYFAGTLDSLSDNGCINWEGEGEGDMLGGVLEG